jgi:ABC-type uncharacterized transport system substrate-binding protein
MITGRKFFLFTVYALIVLCPSAEAQQPTKISHIGFLSVSPVGSVRTEAFRQGLRDLGYMEGRNIIVEWRSGDGSSERTAALAAELLRLKVDLIVTGGAGATRPAKAATKTVPIVMALDNDPVGSGFVTSLARPGGNITGLSSLDSVLSGKRVELLKEIVPRLSRVAVFGGSGRNTAETLNAIERSAAALGVTLQRIDVLAPNDIEPAFRAAVRGLAGAVQIQISGPILNTRGSKIIQLAVKNRLPAIYYRPTDVDAGGLAAYSANTEDLFRRAATYVDKILKGAKPGDLPVEQPTKSELVINLKTAKQIRLTIPPDVLARADRVIR